MRPRTPRRTLDASEVRKALKSIERQLVRQRDSWGLRGWSVVGRAPRFRIQVHVDVMLANPAVPVTPVDLPKSIGGGQLKLAIAATHASLPPRVEVEGSNGRLYPGSPIRAVSGGSGSRAGAAAFAIDNNNVIYMLTCGHAFAGGSGYAEVSGNRVANVELNALGPHRLDAALCRLTSHGLALARASANAPTWFDDVHWPDPDDNHEEVTFHPTHGGSGSSFVQRVDSFACCETVGGVSFCKLITLPECTLRGDSGSLLAFEDTYYGLCTGTSGTLSCFTSIAEALLLFRDARKGLHLWTPNDT